MNSNAAAILETAKTKQICIHFWLIEYANGPVSIGSCRFCGEKRTFKNYPTDCALEHTAFRGLFDKAGKSETELSGSEHDDYVNADIANLEDGEYEREREATCAAT